MTFGMMTCEMNNLEIVWSLCSAVMYFFVVDWVQYQLTKKTNFKNGGVAEGTHN